MKTEPLERYGAVDKCRAVLAVWTECRSAAEVCRELEVSGSLLCQWQDRALSGMLEALEARGGRTAARGPALALPLKRLLDREARLRELQNLGRSALRRARAARNTAAPLPVAAS